jgi:hypothetical protein
MKAGNAARELSCLCINNINARATGDVKPMGRWIGKQIIPTALAADLPAINDFVGLLRGDRMNCCEKSA